MKALWWPLWMGVAALALMAAPSAGAAKATAKNAVERTLLRCEVVYMPARATWVREVALLSKGGRMGEVQIDGQAVYTFTVQDTTVFTSQDNERIQIDLAQRSWRSDLRGQASGQGRCEPVEP